MNILSIDPGPTHSAWVRIESGIPVASNWRENQSVLFDVEAMSDMLEGHLVIEKVMNYGMTVGESVFETVFWTGRFAEAWGNSFTRITRGEVKDAMCHDQKATKANVNQAVRDHYDTINPVGTKKNQGPLYEFQHAGPKGANPHRWDALAVGLTYLEQQKLTPTVSQ